MTSNLLGNFIKKNWGIEIDNQNKTSYSNPCIIRVYREDNKKHLEKFLKMIIKIIIMTLSLHLKHTGLQLLLKSK